MSRRKGRLLIVLFVLRDCSIVYFDGADGLKAVHDFAIAREGVCRKPLKAVVIVGAKHRVVECLAVGPLYVPAHLEVVPRQVVPCVEKQFDDAALVEDNRKKEGKP